MFIKVAFQENYSALKNSWLRPWDQTSNQNSFQMGRNQIPEVKLLVKPNFNQSIL